ncbi:MaoC family dehydratase [Pararobbsia silviterrae]|uniref:MaoC family dehydratase n=1 Tax=Pararobbsia silviterrae TaxID=1792498 RepID=A0A494XYW5_9BURK|nr:MaoC family dehydratase [Pararobbsia silviterrae]RKP55707.1 MaoC family dehydratase [Pararobbsia silviterrae]
MRKKLYLDEMSVGMQYTSEEHEMTVADIKRFAGEFDPQPFHLDEEAARSSLFGGLAASGWHTAAVTMRLLTQGGVPVAGGSIGLGGEITWPRPTRPGDRLHVVTTITDIRHSQSKPGQGVVTTTSETFNQAGEIVQRFVAKLIAFTREASEAQASAQTSQKS